MEGTVKEKVPYLNWSARSINRYFASKEEVTKNAHKERLKKRKFQLQEKGTRSLNYPCSLPWFDSFFAI